MVRFVLAMVTVLCLSVAVQAEEVRGLVKSVDGKMSVVLMVGTTEKKLELAPTVKVLGTFSQGRILRRPVTMEVSTGLASLQPNTQVLCTTQMVNGKEVVTQIVLEGTVVRRILR